MRRRYPREVGWVRKINNKIRAEDCVVLMDFDNTITTRDVFDGLLLDFAKDNGWVRLEEEWNKGRIGSRKCLAGQIKSIRVKKAGLEKYLKGIKLDPGFKRLIGFLESKKIKPVVLSDNFDFILNKILELNGISGLPVYSNKLSFAGDRLIPHFPHTNRSCLTCAHCKKKNLLARRKKDSIIIYIGDGRSDICPAGQADIIFAKAGLLERYKDRQGCLGFENLAQVKKCFQKIIR